MKKTILLIFVLIITIIATIFTRYIDLVKQNTEIKKINDEFLLYQKSDVQINTIVSLMNKAIQLNKTNKIKQDNNLIFEENNKNSIKIYLETNSTQKEDEKVKIPMEELILNEKVGVEKVEYAFSDLIFKISNVEYHQKSGQIKSITFSQK